MVIVIAGPTAVGKTDLSLFLAHKLNGEIINCDSTQIYKGIDIATNKAKDLEGIKHHLYDTLDLSKDYTVFDYQKDARKIIDSLLSQNKTPILVGGTGLYIKAALYDYTFDKKNNNTYDNISTEELYNKLLKVDKNTKIHKNNRIRIINSLNYYEANNKPYSSKEKNNKLLYDTIFIGLTTDRDILYDKINKRVDEMVKEGLIEEAKKLYGLNYKSVMTPIGPKELFLYFDNKITLDEAIDLIKSKSRKYAKRQYTWFNNQMNLKWFKTDYDNFDNTKEDVLNYIKNLTPPPPKV